MFAGEPGNGLRGGGFGRTEDALHGIGLTGGETFDAQHEASRGGIQADGIVGDFQLLKGEAQVFERRGNHPIGDFLGADFEQEGEAHWPPSLALGELQLAWTRLRIGPQVGNAARHQGSG